MVRQIHVDIPYGETSISFTIPESCLKGIYTPKKVPLPSSAEEEIKKALSNPVSALSLGELAAGKKRVLIVADDVTRPTPTDIISPIILDELNAAGICDDSIQLLIALGTHRAMTLNEIEFKYGKEVAKRIEIINHNAFDKELLIQMGSTRAGIPVMLNHLVKEADLILGIGTIVPHHIPGFSGGAKIIQPGICGERTTGEVHLLSVRSSEMSMLGILENQVRHEMETIAERAGLSVILNTILDADGRLVGAIYGDPKKAFRLGVELSRSVYGVQVAEKTDIVVAGSHPCDIEFWQAHKTLYAAEQCVRQNGIIIVVTPCPEGVAVTHPEMVQFAGQTMDEIEAKISSGHIDDLTAAALGLAWANTRRHAQIYLVSEGISDAEARMLNFVPFSTVNGALESAFLALGEDASVSVLPYAPDTLPLLN
jgi:nickel-dependent lactate racemase